MKQMSLWNTALDRRAFCAGGLGLLGQSMQAAPRPSSVRFGLMADLHHNRMPGAEDRLHQFLEAVGHRSPDFIIQLGDFCDGYSAQLTDDQKRFLKTWHDFRATKYSVLGNHEMDHSPKERMVDLLRMPKNYYAFDRNGIHFVVVDCMNLAENGKIVNYVEGNYFRHSESEINLVDPEQMDWLQHDLRTTRLPTVVFTHPCINAYWKQGAERTRANVRQVLSQANREAGWQKVIACFSGHHHVDHHSESGGVNYFLVNSASYYWVGKEFGKLARYRDPLFTFVTIHASGSLTIEGKASTFVPPTPADLKYPDAKFLTASIEARTVHFQVSSGA
ncbi:MAG TPA: metallophosphoesterase [Bryobacteraceae bacterium]|nr:metallophosphoesterase [Bryobacteraceae bacterium]